MKQKLVLALLSLLAVFTTADNLFSEEANVKPQHLINSGKFYTDISFLIWQSKEESLEYASKTKVLSSDENSPDQKTDIIIPDFGWRPGLKAALGYIFDYDKWDGKLLWTYYKGEFTNVKKHSNAPITPANNGVIPLYFYNFLNGKVNNPPRYEHSTGDWYMHFNSIDLELGRNFLVTQKFSTRLLTGIKTAWINHDYNVFYVRGNTLKGNLDNVLLNKQNIHFKNDSLGVGPRIGLDAKCHLCDFFNLIATTSFSSLITKFDVSRDGNYEITDLDTDTDHTFKTNLKEHFYQIKPNVQLLLGFEFNKKFSELFCKFSIAYEMQYFWGQNQIKRFIDDSNTAVTYSNCGDLQMQGLTASLGLEF